MTHDNTPTQKLDVPGPMRASGPTPALAATTGQRPVLPKLDELKPPAPPATPMADALEARSMQDRIALDKAEREAEERAQVANLGKGLLEPDEHGEGMITERTQEQIAHDEASHEVEDGSPQPYSLLEEAEAQNELLDDTSEHLTENIKNRGTSQLQVSRVATMWTVILNREVTEEEATLMLSALALTKLVGNPQDYSEWVELGAQATIGGTVTNLPVQQRSY